MVAGGAAVPDSAPAAVAAVADPGPSNDQISQLRAAARQAIKSGAEVGSANLYLLRCGQSAQLSLGAQGKTFFRIFTLYLRIEMFLKSSGGLKQRQDGSDAVLMPGLQTEHSFAQSMQSVVSAGSTFQAYWRAARSFLTPRQTRLFKIGSLPHRLSCAGRRLGGQPAAVGPVGGQSRQPAAHGQPAEQPGSTEGAAQRGAR